MTAQADTRADEWEGILDPDEQIIWQGRPDGAFVLKPAMIGLAIFGTFFAGFALFWMIAASMAGGIFWMFGLLHFGVGVSLVVGSLMGPSYVRRRTWYTLTDQRAMIAKVFPLKGRSLKSYPITKDTNIEYADDGIPSVFFATEQKRRKGGHYSVPVGFERITDAKAVMQMIRKIQKDAE